MPNNKRLQQKAKWNQHQAARATVAQLYEERKPLRSIDDMSKIMMKALSDHLDAARQEIQLSNICTCSEKLEVENNDPIGAVVVTDPAVNNIVHVTMEDEKVVLKTDVNCKSCMGAGVIKSEPVVLYGGPFTIDTDGYKISGQAFWVRMEDIVKCAKSSCKDCYGKGVIAFEKAVEVSPGKYDRRKFDKACRCAHKEFSKREKNVIIDQERGEWVRFESFSVEPLPLPPAPATTQQFQKAQ